MPSLKTAADFASHAAGLVGGDREKTHGSKLKNFDNIAIMWNAYLTIRADPSAPLTAEDVGHMMGLMKKARTQHGSFNLDDYVDDVGYAACTAEIAVEMKARRERAEVDRSLGIRDRDRGVVEAPRS